MTNLGYSLEQPAEFYIKITPTAQEITIIIRGTKLWIEFPGEQEQIIQRTGEVLNKLQDAWYSYRERIQVEYWNYFEMYGHFREWCQKQNLKAPQDIEKNKHYVFVMPHTLRHKLQYIRHKAGFYLPGEDETACSQPASALTNTEEGTAYEAIQQSYSDGQKLVETVRRLYSYYEMYFVLHKVAVGRYSLGIDEFPDEMLREMEDIRTSYFPRWPEVVWVSEGGESVSDALKAVVTADKAKVDRAQIGLMAKLQKSLAEGREDFFDVVRQEIENYPFFAHVCVHGEEKDLDWMSRPWAAFLFPSYEQDADKAQKWLGNCEIIARSFGYEGKFVTKCQNFFLQQRAVARQGDPLKDIEIAIRQDRKFWGAHYFIARSRSLQVRLPIPSTKFVEQYYQPQDCFATIYFWKVEGISSTEFSALLREDQFIGERGADESRAANLNTALVDREIASAMTATASAMQQSALSQSSQLTKSFIFPSPSKPFISGTSTISHGVVPVPRKERLPSKELPNESFQLKRAKERFEGLPEREKATFVDWLRQEHAEFLEEDHLLRLKKRVEKFKTGSTGDVFALYEIWKELKKADHAERGIVQDQLRKVFELAIYATVGFVIQNPRPEAFYLRARWYNKDGKQEVRNICRVTKEGKMFEDQKASVAMK